MSRIITSGEMLREMPEEGIERAALADPVAHLLTEADLVRVRRTPRAKTLRRALALTQEEFAGSFHIPLRTLRDWEQGRAEPDQATQAYLTIIARDPERVNELLNIRRSPGYEGRLSTEIE